MDEMDKTAEQEGIALEKLKEFRIKRISGKSRTKLADKGTLDKAFLDHWGCRYVSKPFLPTPKTDGKRRKFF